MQNHTDEHVNISYDQLELLIAKNLTQKGLDTVQAKTVAACIATAELYGVTSHGVCVLQAHINKIVSGGYNLEPVFSVIREGGAFAVIDGDNAVGPVSATHCMNYAIERCKDTGIFTVLSRHNNTYGPAFYYPLLAAKSGYIGVTYCNSPAAMAPVNGKDKLLGTNPFSIAIPCKSSEPVILDMATSIVAKSRINQARIACEKIPEGWALDQTGCPTTDPLEAIKGLLLPIEGYKGYGIAMMIDIMAGVLSGAAFLDSVGKFYCDDNKCMNVGYSFTVIDPRQVYGEEFYDTMDEYIKKIRSSAAIDQNLPLALPGDNRIRSRACNMQAGMCIKRELLEQITSL